MGLYRIFLSLSHAHTQIAPRLAGCRDDLGELKPGVLAINSTKRPAAVASPLHFEYRGRVKVPPRFCLSAFQY